MVKCLEMHHSIGAVPKALREREDDILPYGEWCACHHRKSVTGRVRELAGYVQSKGRH